MPRRLTLVDFYERIEVDEGGCWIWTGAVDRTLGYGLFGSTPNPPKRNVPRRAHRFAYETLVGPVQDGHNIHHACGVKLCVNPAHLKAVSAQEHGTIHAPNGNRCQRGHPPSEYARRPSKGYRLSCRACDRDRKRRKRVAAREVR